MNALAGGEVAVAREGESSDLSGPQCARPGLLATLVMNEECRSLGAWNRTINDLAFGGPTTKVLSVSMVRV
jgi:hypothetical protein